MYKHTHACTHMYVCACVCTFKHTHTCTHMYVRMCMCMYKHTHTHTYGINSSWWKWLHTDTQTNWAFGVLHNPLLFAAIHTKRIKIPMAAGSLQQQRRQQCTHNEYDLTCTHTTWRRMQFWSCVVRSTPPSAAVGHAYIRTYRLTWQVSSHFMCKCMCTYVHIRTSTHTRTWHFLTGQSLLGFSTVTLTRTPSDTRHDKEHTSIHPQTTPTTRAQ